MLRCSLRQCGVEKRFLAYCAQFLNDLSCTTTQCASRATTFCGTQAAVELIRRAGAADCLLDREVDAAELRAVLVTALMCAPKWGGVPSKDNYGLSLGELERNLADYVAGLLLLPSRFTWYSRTQGGRFGGENKHAKAGVLAVSEHSSHSLGVPCQSPPTANELAEGGGIVHSSSLESFIVLLTTAKAQAYARYLSSKFSSPDDESRVSQRLVLYCSDHSDKLLLQAARCVGIRHIRTLQTVYSPKVRNYPLQVDILKAALAEDVSHGLYPLLVSGVFGSHVTASVDPLHEMAELCTKLGMWFHIDAGYSGFALSAGCAISTGSQPKEASTLVESETIWAEHVCSFNRAAALADSIHFGVSTCYLPTPTAGSPAALLYMADVSKVDAALRQVNSLTASAVNAWYSFPVSSPAQDMLLLRLEPHSLHAAEIVRLSLIFNQLDSVDVSRRVRDHQAAMYYFQQRLRADGRFDCSILASYFGAVLFRWLLLADEETETLMWRWSELLKSRDTSGKWGVVVRPSLRLVRIQRRVHICVSLWSGIAETTNPEAQHVQERDIEALVDSLKEAADLACNRHRVA